MGNPVAEKATIYKVNLQVADMDRNSYGDYNLTIALHPSETIERMMVRILAFCYRSAENLSFTRGLSSVDEPELWLKHDDGRILNWIEVGQPMPDRLKKASSQAEKVEVFTYGRGHDVWWNTHANAINNLPKVSLYFFAAEELQALSVLAAKTMNLNVTIVENIAYVSSSDANFEVTLHEMPAHH